MTDAELEQLVQHWGALRVALEIVSAARPELQIGELTSWTSQSEGILHHCAQKEPGALAKVPAIAQGISTIQVAVRELDEIPRGHVGQIEAAPFVSDLYKAYNDVCTGFNEALCVLPEGRPIYPPPPVPPWLQALLAGRS
jgi:hypothetical protein